MAICARLDDGGVAALAVITDQAWRLLTNNLDAAEHGAPTTLGDDEVAEVHHRTSAIIGRPRGRGQRRDRVDSRVADATVHATTHATVGRSTCSSP